MTNQENYERTILKLIARALIEVRSFASEGDNNACYALADLFHNIPYQLQVARDEGGGFEKIIDWIRMRSEQKKMKDWFESALKDCE
jgi:hypothetical protein